MGIRLGAVPRSRRLAIAVATVGATALWMPMPVKAVVTIGQTFNPNAPCDNVTRIQSTSPSGQYTVPSNGVITSWSRFVDVATDTAKLKVARSVTGGVQIIGESALMTPMSAGLNSAPTRIPVQAGDFIGFHIPPGSQNCGAGVGGYNMHSTAGDTPVGGTITMPPLNAFQLSVSANLEADADNDGFGDESQDQCPTSAATQGPCPTPLTPPGSDPQTAVDTTAPTANITGGPKDKTKKKKTTFSFNGADTRAVAGFQCSLDGAAFVTCTSPYSFKVKKGEHTFSVRAVDDSGNVGQPATDDWKVKRKKR